MKIKVNTKSFSSAIDTALRAVSTKGVIPALEGVKIDATEDKKLKITGYDLEIANVIEIDAEEVKEPGSIVLSARLLSQLVKKAPDAFVELNVNDKGKATLKSGKSKYNMVGIPTSEYPDLPHFDTKDNLLIEGELLTEGINQVIYAVSTDNKKPIYTGALFEIEPGKLTLVGIDGYRMGVKSIPFEGNEVTTDVVIPAKVLAEVTKTFGDVDNVNIAIGQRNVAFKADNVTIIGRLIEGEFLAYKTTIPKEFKTTVTVETKALREAIERLNIFNYDKVPQPLRFNVDSEIDITIKTPIGEGEETFSPLEATIEGESVVSGINLRYFLDAVKHITAEKVNIKFNGGLSPIILVGDGDNTELHLVVPMRLAKDNK